jgi:hypothetical protein
VPTSCTRPNLKGGNQGSDTGHMFVAVPSLSPLQGAKLERLRLSLNTPVVAIERLPVGPAAAGIALHRGAESTRLTVAVRSTRSGQVVFFQPDGWGDREPADLALDAALSFAEGMGFLFDEDLLERGLDPTQAARAWADLLEESAPDEEAWAAEAPPPPEAPLLLSKFRFLSAISAERLLSPPAPPPPERPAASHFVLRLLSRF